MIAVKLFGQYYALDGATHVTLSIYIRSLDSLSELTMVRILVKLNGCL